MTVCSIFKQQGICAREDFGGRRVLYTDVSDLLVDEPSYSQTVPAGCNTSASYRETIYWLNVDIAYLALGDLVFSLLQIHSLN